jgi:EAL domain-containing protein (putative c-di-GMP-specific phosphodiesterase class I)
MVEWRRLGLALPSIAVNVSGRDFMRQESVLRLSEAVDQARLSASLFELELTEGVLMQDAEAGRRLLLAMKELGFALAVDDFGTGYCSLNYLKRFPLDTLKIDRSFVEDIGVDADDAAIVRAIIALGHNLNLKIVAEGVSKPTQLEFLRREGCDAVQGYLFGAAMPANAFTSLLVAAQTASAISSISTQAPSGSCATPTALRA